DKGVEVVEGANHTIGDVAALWSIGVHIGEMAETCFQLRLAIHRNPVRWLCQRSSRSGHGHQKCEHGGAEHEATSGFQRLVRTLQALPCFTADLCHKSLDGSGFVARLAKAIVCSCVWALDLSNQAL